MAVDWSKYGGESTRTERKSTSHVDWNKYDPAVQEDQKRREGAAIRASAPELFDPIQQSNNFKARIAPTTAPAPVALPSVQQQLQTAVSAFKPQAGGLTTEPEKPSFQEKLSDRRADRMEDASSSKIGSTLMQLADPIFTGLDALQIVTKPAADIAQELYTPGAGLTAITGATMATGNLISKLAPKLGMGSGLGATVGREAIKEGVVGTQLGAGQSLASNPEGGLEKAGEQALWGGLIGAAGGGAMAGLGKGAQAIINKYRKPATSPTLELPAPRQRGNVNTAEPVETITPEYTFRLNEPSPSSVSREANVSQARDELKIIDDEIRQLNSSYERAVIDEFKYLRKSMDDRGGVQQGQIQRDINGEVVGRTGRVSNNPLWYQEFHAANGKAPSNKELYQLARERVDEGFKDEAGDIPSWKSQNGFDDSMTALQRVRSQIDSTLKEFDPAIQVTDSPLLNSKLSFKPKTADSAVKQTDTLLQANPDQQVRAAITPEAEADEILQAVNKPRVRDRVYSYLDEQETAARKRIAGRRNRLSANPLDEWADHSIIMAAKLGKGTIKAADFTEELVKEFGESIRPIADKIFRRTKEVLRTQERRASEDGLRAENFNNSGIGDAESFGKKISRDAKAKKVPFKERTEKLRAQLVDDMAPLEDLEKRVTGKVASAEDSIYKTARLYRGTPEKAHQIVQTRLAPIVEAVEKAGHTTDDLGMYALAKHAKDVNEAGYKSGFTNAEIDAVLTKFKSEEMDAAQQALIQISKDMMQELVDNGVVSKELSEVLADRWKNYVPLFRAFDDDKVEFGTGIGKSLANVTSPVKALKGSERKVVDPLENMVKNIFQSTSAAERNKVATQLTKLAEKDIEGEFVRKLDPDELVGRKNVVNVKVNGENVPYEVDPDVYTALMQLDKETTPIIINALSKPASVLRTGATLTPEFSLRNPMRDIVAAYVNSDSGFNPITDFTAGLVQSISKGPLYREWIENLGAYGNVLSMDRVSHKKALEKVLKETTSKKFMNVVTGRSLFRVLRAITDTTESATKVGEYRAALRKGVSPEEAAYRSRDLMDFARSGSGVRQANKVVAFLNANIQGKSKLYRTFKQHPVRSSMRAFTSITVPTIAAYAVNELLANDTQKQTISEAPNWMRDTFWLLAIPGTDVVARIPKPFDLAPAFANLPERALDFARGKDKKAMDGFLQRTLSSGSLPYQITALMPLMEGMSGYSFFKEGDIVPQREQGLERKDQYDPVRTTETGKMLASAASKLTGDKGAFKNFSSPRVMDNTIRGLTAGLGAYGTDVIDLILKGTGAVDRPTSPQKRLEQQPLVRAFTVDPLQAGKSMDTLYRARDDLSRKKASSKLNKEPFKETAKLKQLDSIAGSIGDINSSIREIERSEKLSAKEKRVQIEALMQLRNKLAKGASDKINQ